MDDINSGRGTQTLERAVKILRLLAEARAQGLRLIDVQKKGELSRPTCHRILNALCREKLVEQDPVSKRYHIGIEMRFLASAAPEVSSSLLTFARPHLRRLAELTGDTIFLMVRSESDVVCVDRQSGSYPIKALTGEIGTRRPLGVGASGLVLLSCLPDPEVEDVIARVRPRLREYPNVSEPVVRAAIRETRSSGFAYSDGHTVPEVRGLGVPILNHQGVPIAAVSLAAIRGRIAPSRIAELVAALEKTRQSIEKHLRSRSARAEPIRRSD